jgi:hypothetical protein
MKDSVYEFYVGYWVEQWAKYSWVYFNSKKEAKNYVAKNYASKKLFKIETDGKTTWVIYPIF